MDAFFEQLTPVYGVLVGLTALWPLPRARALGAVGLVLLGLAAAAAAVSGSPAGSFIVVNELIAAAGLGLVLLAPLVWLRQRSQSAAHPMVRAERPITRPGLALLGLGLAVVVPELLRQGLPADQLSLEAERLLALGVGLLAFGLAGLPPLHRAPWGRSLAPVSATLLARVLAELLPHGLVTWQAPALLLLGGALVWSAWHFRWTAVAIAGGLAALWSGTPAGSAPFVLVLWGWLVETGVGVAARRGVWLDPAWAGLVALPPGLAALPAGAAALRAQVLLSVLAAAGLAAGLLRRWKRSPQPQHAGVY